MKLLILVIYYCIVFNNLDFSNAKGLLLLYKPQDVTTACALSRELRYDISFGMGMADTISLVLRTETYYDFKCIIEIITDRSAYIILVIYYTNTVEENCFFNPNAFVLLYEGNCHQICDYLPNRDVTHAKEDYYTSVHKHRVKLLYTSNSSLNSDMSVNFYQITATSSRLLHYGENCTKGNETFCSVAKENFCFTNGVVCDGIKNCGVNDWFDERQNSCGLPVLDVGVAPVVTVIAVFCCAFLAGCHLLMKHLPPVAKSFFIFNTNEDNRLYVEPVFIPPIELANRDQAIKRKYSIIPVSSSISSFYNDSDEVLSNEHMEKELKNLCMTGAVIHMKPTEITTQEPQTSTLLEDTSTSKSSAWKKMRNKIMSASRYIQKHK